MSALENLAKSLSEAVRKILRLPVVDERAVKELVRDLQRALLQSDVNVNLVLDVSRRVEERGLREKLPPGISRRDHIIKVLYEELTKLIGDEPAKWEVRPGDGYIMMMVGVQGSGKTTACVKIARFHQKRGLKAGIVCADTYRPGAYEQLKQFADKVGLPTFGDPSIKDPVKIALSGISHFKRDGYDLIIIDTAGRHKDEVGLMEEMRVLAEAIKPNEVNLVIDASIGQAAITQAKAFHEATKIGSITITKLDGTAKGGGAISAVAATGAKIKFISVGERPDDLEQFNPSNFVGRLLGLGDISSLIERVKEAEISITEKRARAIVEGRLTLKDMYEQLEAFRKLGPLKRVLSLLPGGSGIPDEVLEVAEKKLDSWRVIIQSMTAEEVENPKILNPSRIRRIARGSGKAEKEVRELVAQYLAMKRLMKALKRRHMAALKRFMP